MSANAKQKAGRKYTVDAGGITTLKKDFIVVQDSAMAANGETLTFPGVPAIGSKHPAYPGLYVESYDVQEGDGTNKNVLTVTVNYGPRTTETSGEGESAVAVAVDEWGWDDGTDERELVSGADGTPVRNSAGEPFESVPKYMVPAPVFVKVMKFKGRQSGWQDARCKVNASSITIGGVTCPAGSLLCTVGEKRLIGNADWKYQYTVRLRYKSNPVKIKGAKTETDIGWDVSVADVGMREVGKDGKTELIRDIDPETKKPCTVTTAALLDGKGKKLARGEEPYNFRFQTYKRADFPIWFYSEPSLAEEGLQ